MVDHNDIEEEEIKLQQIKFRFAVSVFILAIAVLVSQVFLKGMVRNYEPVEEFVDVPAPSEMDLANAYEPIAFNESEVKNGIHVPTGMVADTGVAEVIQNCGACHSLDLVKQNRATAEGWKEIITWMQETQKLWDLGLKEPIIIKYLAKNYGPENTGRRKNLVIEEWYKL